MTELWRWTTSHSDSLRSAKQMLKKASKKGLCNVNNWQRWLAKISFFIVMILLLESYRDIIYGRSQDQLLESTRNASSKEDKYSEKINSVLKNLEFLQKGGQLGGIRISKRLRAPDFAVDKGKSDMKHSDMKNEYSPIPCELGMQPSTDWNHPIKPRFRLNADRFIYPILKNQPVDQLIGLRQSILLAIRLNRTLVMPYFHNHNYGRLSQYNPALPPSLKVNVDLLRRFVSVISVEEMHEKCHGKFDVALLTGQIDVPPGPSSLLKAQSELQMRMLNTQNMSVKPDFTVRFIIPRFPNKLKPKSKLSVVPRDLSSLYPPESERYRCAVHPFPLNFLDVQTFLRKAMKLPNHKVDISKVKDEVLYSAIWYYTQSPVFIHALATDMIESVMKATRVNGAYNFLCLNYHKHSGGEETEVHMNTLRRVIDLMVDLLNRKSNPMQLNAIYIASPQSKQDQARLYQQNLKIFDKHTEIPVFSSDDVTKSWKKYYRGERSEPESICALLEEDTQDVLSLVEMQICTESAVFIRSIGSSWAANVQAKREKTEYSVLDASISDLIESRIKS